MGIAEENKMKPSLLNRYKKTIVNITFVDRIDQGLMEFMTKDCIEDVGRVMEVNENSIVLRSYEDMGQGKEEAHCVIITQIPLEDIRSIKWASTDDIDQFYDEKLWGDGPEYSEKEV